MNAAGILSELADWALRNSLAAGMMALLVLLAQASVGRRLKPAWRHALWLLVFLRLALPAAPQSPLSLSNLLPAQWPYTAGPAQRTGSAIAVGEPARAPTEPARPRVGRMIPQPAPQSVPAARLKPTIGSAGMLVPAPAPPPAEPLLADASGSDEAKQAPKPEPMAAAPPATQPVQQASQGTRAVCELASDAAAARPQAVGYADVRAAPSAKQAPDSNAGSQNDASPGRPWWRLLVYVWVVVAGLLLLRMLIATVLLAARLARATPPDDARLPGLLEACRARLGLRRYVRVVETSAVAAPAVAGIFRPRVLLPIGLAGSLNTSQLRLVLLHELGHVKRLDVPVQWFAGVLAALHWFNPLVHLANARLRLERELACDAAVLSAQRGGQSEYGHLILTLLERLRHARALSVGLVGVLEGRQAIRRRITMIAEFGKQRSWGAAPAIILLAALAMLSCDAQSQSGAPAPKPEAKADARPPSAAATKPPAAKAETEEDPADAAIRAALQKQADLNLSDVLLEQALEEIRVAAGVPMEVKWAPLEQAGANKDTKVTAKLGKIRLERALNVILSQAGGPIPLGYAVDDGVLVVSSQDDLSRKTFTRLYDVRDLVETRETGDRSQAMNELISLAALIRKTVGPNSWEEGATLGRITPHNGVLVVTQSYENQQAVAKLLEDMRRLQVPQWRREIMEKLAKRQAKLEFGGTAFSDVIDFMREMTGVNIVVDNRVGDNLPPVNVKVNDVTNEQALSLITKAVGLDWRLMDGAVYISGQIGGLAGGGVGFGLAVPSVSRGASASFGGPGSMDVNPGMVRPSTRPARVPQPSR